MGRGVFNVAPFVFGGALWAGLGAVGGRFGVAPASLQRMELIGDAPVTAR